MRKRIDLESLDLKDLPSYGRRGPVGATQRIFELREWQKLRKVLGPEGESAIAILCQAYDPDAYTLKLHMTFDKDDDSVIRIEVDPIWEEYAFEPEAPPTKKKRHLRRREQMDL
jgi:hypothetical protein